MKTFLLRLFCFMALLVLCLAPAFSQIDTSAIAPVVSGSHPGLAAYVGFVLAGYELIVRLVPTSRTLSIVGAVLRYVYKVSTFLDNVKKPKAAVSR
jgi:hypothetical protein